MPSAMENVLFSTVLSICLFGVIDAQTFTGSTSPTTDGRPTRCNSSEEQACEVFQRCGFSCDSHTSKPSLHQACGISCSSPSVQHNASIQRQVCYCDQICSDFGDCCHDYKPSVTNFTSIKPYSECLELDYSITPLGSIVISRCPSDFTNRNITSNCHSETSDDILQGLPVNGFLRDGRYYSFRNIYCALCHSVNILQILQKGTFWNATFKPKSELLPMTSDEQKSLFDRTVQNLTGMAKLQALYISRDFDMLLRAPPLAHHCNAHVEPMRADCTEFCPANGAECLSYMYFSDYFSHTSVDNVKLQFGGCPAGGWPMLFCFDPRPPSSLTNAYSSFADLLDFTGLSGEDTPKKLLPLMPLVKCTENRIYDKQAKKCRPFVCPTGKYLMLNGSCGYDTLITNSDKTFWNETKNISYPFDINCLMVTYTQDEYKVEDDIAYVNSGLSFPPGDYFIQGNLLYVCNPFSNGTGLRFFEYNKTQNNLTIAGNVISLCCLAIFVLTYTLFRELRTLPGQIMMNLAITLFMAQLIMLAAMDRTEIQMLCKTVAIVEHFLWLCAFFWMNSMCFSVFKTFYKIMEIKKPSPYAIYKYVMYSLLGPLLIVLTCIILEFATDVPFQYADEERCWISGHEGILYGFALPLAIIIFTNVLFIVFTIIQFIRAKRQVRRNIKNKRENNRVFLITVKLSTVMGSTWIFGYLGALTGSHVLWYLFIIFNSLQGLFIFLAYICREKILMKYRKLFMRSMNLNSSSFSTDSRESAVVLSNISTNSIELNDSETTKM